MTKRDALYEDERAREKATLEAGIAYEGELQFGFIKGWDAALAYAREQQREPRST